MNLINRPTHPGEEGDQDDETTVKELIDLILTRIEIESKIDEANLDYIHRLNDLIWNESMWPMSAHYFDESDLKSTPMNDHSNRTDTPRIFYVNHQRLTTGWLPPPDIWYRIDSILFGFDASIIRDQDSIGNFLNQDQTIRDDNRNLSHQSEHKRSPNNPLPYGWEEAIDQNNQIYYINHINCSTTYFSPLRASPNSDDERSEQPHSITLKRSEENGFGFIVGSERPVQIRYVKEGGPSESLLEANDEILLLNDQDVREAPLQTVVKIIQSNESITIVVRRPVRRTKRENTHYDKESIVRKERSILLTKSEKIDKRKSNQFRVRFAKDILVIGSPLFNHYSQPPSSISTSTLTKRSSMLGGTSSIANSLRSMMMMSMMKSSSVLKVFLENDQTRTFHFDGSTIVQDIVDQLCEKLAIKSNYYFGLVCGQIIETSSKMIVGRRVDDKFVIDLLNKQISHYKWLKKQKRLKDRIRRKRMISNFFTTSIGFIGNSKRDDCKPDRNDHHLHHHQTGVTNNCSIDNFDNDDDEDDFEEIDDEIIESYQNDNKPDVENSDDLLTMRRLLNNQTITLLNPTELVCNIFRLPNSENLRCLFRVIIVDPDPEALWNEDPIAFEYYYRQCCNDIAYDRFAPRIPTNIVIRLATLSIFDYFLNHLMVIENDNEDDKDDDRTFRQYNKNIAQNFWSPHHLKYLNQEYSLSNFVPITLFGSMKLKKLIQMLSFSMKCNRDSFVRFVIDLDDDDDLDAISVKNRMKKQKQKNSQRNHRDWLGKFSLPRKTKINYGFRHRRTRKKSSSLSSISSSTSTSSTESVSIGTKSPRLISSFRSRMNFFELLSKQPCYGGKLYRATKIFHSKFNDSKQFEFDRNDPITIEAPPTLAETLRPSFKNRQTMNSTGSRTIYLNESLNINAKHGITIVRNENNNNSTSSMKFLTKIENIESIHIKLNELTLLYHLKVFFYDREKSFESDKDSFRQFPLDHRRNRIKSFEFCLDQNEMQEFLLIVQAYNTLLCTERQKLVKFDHQSEQNQSKKSFDSDQEQMNSNGNDSRTTEMKVSSKNLKNLIEQSRIEIVFERNNRLDENAPRYFGKHQVLQAGWNYPSQSTLLRETNRLLPSSNTENYWIDSKQSLCSINLASSPDNLLFTTKNFDPNPFESFNHLHHSSSPVKDGTILKSPKPFFKSFQIEPNHFDRPTIRDGDCDKLFDQEKIIEELNSLCDQLDRLKSNRSSPTSTNLSVQSTPPISLMNEAVNETASISSNNDDFDFTLDSFIIPEPRLPPPSSSSSLNDSLLLLQEQIAILDQFHQSKDDVQNFHEQNHSKISDPSGTYNENSTNSIENNSIGDDLLQATSNGLISDAIDSESLVSNHQQVHLTSKESENQCLSHPLSTPSSLSVSSKPPLPPLTQSRRNKRFESKPQSNRVPNQSESEPPYSEQHRIKVIRFGEERDSKSSKESNTDTSKIIEIDEDQLEEIFDQYQNIIDTLLARLEEIHERKISTISKNDDRDRDEKIAVQIGSNRFDSQTNPNALRQPQSASISPRKALLIESENFILISKLFIEFAMDGSFRMFHFLNDCITILERMFRFCEEIIVADTKQTQAQITCLVDRLKEVAAAYAYTIDVVRHLIEQSDFGEINPYFNLLLSHTTSLATSLGTLIRKLHSMA
ncbi:FERM and PDZ domain-containing protein 4 [Sarcoptes scabiei]|uniref:FERM and PDZ domain-containing protein 4 n=1 Tax=Sarcoptes scabiei TaxID=52283 RepID=A0A834VH10_SARSC|nr:FERM and PDZ domain-containing protein 4 [Sarcoptes scabiei]